MMKLFSPHSFLRVFATILLVIGVGSSSVFASNSHINVDALLAEVSKNLASTPEGARVPLQKLKELENKFSKSQQERYYLLRSSSLGFWGEHSEQVAFVLSIIDKVENAEARASFLYNLTNAYARLGRYELALEAMNEGIIILPKLTELNSKMDTLQAAVSLFNSLRAYDEAIHYADRMYALETKSPFAITKCIGRANHVEINFLRGESKLAQSILPDAIRICNGDGNRSISLLLKALAVVDLINSGFNEKGLRDGLPLLVEFLKTNQTSDYLTQLEESIARSYFSLGDLKLAELYCLRAYNRARSQDVIELMEKTSETLAAIERAQGKLNNSLRYYDINLTLKKKVLNEQMQKNLAYQRVKFDTQDKANQLALAEQKNKTLIVEKALQQGRNQNLLLFITLGLILLAVLGAWLARTWQQKNLFRTSSQTDGLTHVSNRAHFMACATHAFKDVRNEVSVVLFDMDFFKKINDAFGHAAGDWVLKTVCDVVKAQLLKSDVLGRLGGEEFAICLVGMTSEEVLALAERCRFAIAAVDTTPSGFIFDLSASFGIATRPAHALSPFEEVLAAADKALYLSKNEGRNRVSFHR